MLQGPDLAQDRDPTSSLREARLLAQRAISMQEDWPDGHLILGRVLGLAARHSLTQQLAAGADFAAARASLARGLQRNPSDDEGYLLLASLLHEEGECLAGQGRSPLPSLATARQTLRTGLAKNPGRAALHRLLAEGALLEARFRRTAAPIVDTALPALGEAIRRNPDDRRAHIALAEACLTLATAQRARGVSMDKWLARGRAATTRALAIHPADPVAQRLDAALRKLP